MKKTYFLTMLVILSVTNLLAQQNAYSRFYYQRASLLAKLPIDSTDIVFLGNSITKGCEWSELFNNPHVKNRGISGDRTTGVMDRLNTILPGKPKKIFLMIGVNDLEHGASADSVFNNIRRIIERISMESPKTTLYVQSLLPVNNQFGMYPKHTNKGKEIIYINGKLKKYCRRNSLVFIDLYHSFKNKNDEKMNPKYTNDGLHLLVDGYLLWKSLIIKYVQ